MPIDPRVWHMLASGTLPSAQPQPFAKQLYAAKIKQIRAWEDEWASGMITEAELNRRIRQLGGMNHYITGPDNDSNALSSIMSFPADRVRAPTPQSQSQVLPFRRWPPS